MFSQDKLTCHHQPEMEWGLVRIYFTLVCECKEASILQCFVHNTQVTQLVVGRIIT